jgi:hypothetical protein
MVEEIYNIHNLEMEGVMVKLKSKLMLIEITENKIEALREIKKSSEFEIALNPDTGDL